MQSFGGARPPAPCLLSWAKSAKYVEILRLLLKLRPLSFKHKCFLGELILSAEVLSLCVAPPFKFKIKLKLHIHNNVLCIDRKWDFYDDYHQLLFIRILKRAQI